MSDTADVNARKTETEVIVNQEKQRQTRQEARKEDKLETSGKFREASYVVMFIAAVFVVNAMETGSYRTPWPVAIITTLASLGLFGYSWYLRSQVK